MGLSDDLEEAFQADLKRLYAGEDGAEAAFDLEHGERHGGMYGNSVDDGVDMDDGMAPFTWNETWSSHGGSLTTFWATEDDRETTTLKISRKELPTTRPT